MIGVKKYFLIFSLIFSTVFAFNNTHALDCQIGNDIFLSEQTCFDEQILGDHKLTGVISNGAFEGLIQIIYPDESIYLGGAEQGVLNGYGVRKSENGFILGEWRNDVFLQGIIKENTGYLNLVKLDENQNFNGFQGSLFPDDVRIQIGEVDFGQRDFNGLGIVYNLKTSEYGEEGDFELGTFDNGTLIKDYTSEFIKCEMNSSGRIISSEICFADRTTNNLRSVGLFENKRLSLGFQKFDNGFLSIGQFKPKEDMLGSVLHGIGFFIQSDRMQFELGNYSYGENDGYTINKDLRRNYNYYGEITDRSKNGFGLEINNDYSEYIGLFENNFPIGYGEKIWIKDKKSYKGNFSSNLFEGIGEYEDENGNFYYGEFTNGVYQGHGVLIDAQNFVKQGYFEGGELKDQKNYCITNEDAANYKIIDTEDNCGDLTEASVIEFLNFRSNFINFKSWNSAYYFNKIISDLPFGYSMIPEPDNSLPECLVEDKKVISNNKCFTIIENYEYGNEILNYEGEFNNGIFDGTGIIDYGGGIYYYGNFKDGLIYGYGRIDFPGYSYTGSFNNNAREGFGSSYTDYDKYIGYFRGGNRNGDGIIVSRQSGISQRGFFSDNNIKYSKENDDYEFNSGIGVKFNHIGHLSLIEDDLKNRLLSKLPDFQRGLALRPHVERVIFMDANSLNYINKNKNFHRVTIEYDFFSQEEEEAIFNSELAYQGILKDKYRYAIVDYTEMYQNQVAFNIIIKVEDRFYTIAYIAPYLEEEEKNIAYRDYNNFLMSLNFDFNSN